MKGRQCPRSPQSEVYDGEVGHEQFVRGEPRVGRGFEGIAGLEAARVELSIREGLRYSTAADIKSCSVKEN
jgi:hypothetical protein